MGGSVEANSIAERLAVTPWILQSGYYLQATAEASAEAAFPVPPRRAHDTLQPQDESIIVGYYTSAEVPSPRRRQPGVPFCESFLCGESTSPTGDVSRDSKGAQHPWHTTLVQSLVCYTFPEVYTFLKCKKPHTQHLDGADMGLDASSA